MGEEGVSNEQNKNKPVPDVNTQLRLDGLSEREGSAFPLVSFLMCATPPVTKLVLSFPGFD